MRLRTFQIKCDKCGYVSQGGDETVGAVKHTKCQRSALYDKEPQFHESQEAIIELCGACFAEYISEWVFLGQDASWRETAAERRRRQDAENGGKS